MDLTKLSDTDLDALTKGNMSGMSDEGLALITGTQPTPPDVGVLTGGGLGLLQGVIGGGQRAMAGLDTATIALSKMAGKGVSQLGFINPTIGAIETLRNKQPVEQATQDILENQASREQFWQENMPGAGKNLGYIGAITKGVGGLPYFANAPLIATQALGTGTESAKETLEAGGTQEQALGSAAISAGTNLALAKLAPAFGKSGTTQLASGAAIGAGTTYVDPVLQNALIRSPSNLKEVEMPTKYDVVSGTVLGGTMGRMYGKGKAREAEYLKTIQDSRVLDAAEKIKIAREKLGETSQVDYAALERPAYLRAAERQLEPISTPEQWQAYQRKQAQLAQEQQAAQQKATGGLIGSKVGKEPKKAFTPPEESLTGRPLPEQTSALDRAIQKQKEGRTFDLTAEEKIALRDIESSFNRPEIPVAETPLTRQVGGTARRIGETEAAWTQRRAEVEAQQKADFALASERMQVGQELLTLEPAQTGRSTMPRGIGTKQGGAVNFGVSEFLVEGIKKALGTPQAKKNFENFSRQLQEVIPDVTPAEIQSAWMDQQKISTQQAGIKAMSKINTRLAENLSIYKDVSKEEALAKIGENPDADSPTLGFTTNWIKARGRLGLEKIKNEGVKAGFAYMIGLRDNGRIAANTILHGDDGLIRNLQKLETLRGVGQAGEVLRQRQEAQFNPDYQYKFTPEQQKVHEQLNKLFSDIRTQMEQISGKPVREIPNYFPSMFYGPFAVEVRDSNNRLVGFVTEKNAKAAKDAAQYLLKDLGTGFTVSEPIYRKEITQQGFKGKTGLAPYFESMLDLLSSNDPEVIRAQESVQRIVAKRAMDTRQVQQRFKHKAGVFGAEGEKGWKSAKENYYDAKDVLENYVRAFEDWKANMESSKFLADIQERDGASNTYNILQNYFDDIRGTKGFPSRLNSELANSLAKTGYDVSGLVATGSRKLANGVTKLWLGFWNPVAMAQNILQPIHVLAKLMELATSGGSADIVSPFIIGMSRALADGVALAGHKLGKKTTSEHVKYLLEQEVIKPGLVESASRTKLGDLIEKGGVSGGLLLTEAFARTATFNVFEQYLKKSGYSKSEAQTLAKNLTHDYQVNYESYARPGILANTGVAGELAGRLQTFKINQLTQLANYISELKQHKNPAPLATFLATSIAMAGLSGMIGMDIAEGIYGVLVASGLISPTVKSPRQWALDQGGALAVGLPTESSGKWLSGSLTTNLVGDMSWRNVAPIFAGVGDIASKAPIAKNIVKDFLLEDKATPESEKGQLFTAIAPATVRGIVEDKFLTDPEGRIVSQYTGEVAYKKGPQDEGILNKTNIRSQQRGETMARTLLAKTQEAKINAAIDDNIRALQKTFDEQVRLGKAVSDRRLTEKINNLIDLGVHDPQKIITELSNFIQKNQMGDWFDRQIQAGRINANNLEKRIRAVEQKERLQE